MRVGDIYIWHSFPHQKDGEVKDRWFLFLGEVRNDPFDKVGYGQFQLLAGEEPAKSYTEDLKALPLRMMATLRENRGGSIPASADMYKKLFWTRLKGCHS